MIVFEYDNKIFSLKTTRRKETVEVYKKGFGDSESKIKQIESKYPYTRVALLMQPKTGGPITEFAMAKVGCNPKDSYSPRVGRFQAIKVLNRVLVNRANAGDLAEKQYFQKLNAALWKAVHEELKKAREESLKAEEKRKIAAKEPLVKVAS